MNNEEIWQAILAQIQLDFPKTNFNWFKSTKIVEIGEGMVIISVPNLIVRDWVKDKFYKQILKYIRTINDSIKEIIFQIKEEPPIKPILKGKKQEPQAIPGVGQLGFEEFNLNKNTNLNPKYRFDCFIVGPYNELAHAAACAVAKNPGTVYNPLFIYGGVGLGKTHLLQAIGNEVAQNFRDKKIRYIPTEKLTSEIIAEMRNGTIERVREKYLDTSVFIIDDIQFISGKERTQDEFFYIFNTLYNKNLQIVLSSDRAPKAIPELSDRLRSRFEGGMIADVSAPDFETRMAILKTKCQQLQLSFSDEILSLLAVTVHSNVRELEGALTKLAAQTKLKNINPTKEVCESIISQLNPKKTVNYKKIIQGVASFYDLKERDIMSDSRKREIVRPRQVVMYLLREELNASFPTIGRKIGNKDHTTVMHAYKKISLEIKTDEGLQEEISLLKQKIYNS